jgi:hypothetical protein
MKNLGEVVNSMFGEQFLEKLTKNAEIAIHKPLAAYGINGSEIAQSLNVIPRAVMSWLVLNILPMKVGDSLNRPLDPIDPLVQFNVQKIDRDLYNGTLEKGGKEITRFKNRTLPGIGLVIMSTLELYKPEDLQNMPEQPAPVAAACQHSINHEMLLRDSAKAGLFSQLTYEEILKLRIKTEIELARLKTEIEAMRNISAPVVPAEPVAQKLRRFLENRDIEKSERTFEIILAKSENSSCADCGQPICVNGKLIGCLCLGDQRNDKIFLKKTEKGTQIKFSKSWDIENIELMLDILKRRNK